MIHIEIHIKIDSDCDIIFFAVWIILCYKRFVKTKRKQIKENNKTKKDGSSQWEATLANLSSSIQQSGIIATERIIYTTIISLRIKWNIDEE